MDTAIPREPLPVTQREMDEARRMVRRCRAFLDAEDIVQEALIAYSRYPRTPTIPPGRTPAQARLCLLWGIVVRQVARHGSDRARRARRGETPMSRESTRDRDDEDPRLDRASGCELARVSSPSAEDHILQHGRATLLRAAVAELAATHPALHAVIELHLEGMSMSRIAAHLGIPLGTGWTRLRLARDALRETLRRWEGRLGR